jgi:outer membrane lipopolysaccharide assembly protein LptE/RlpB
LDEVAKTVDDVKEIWVSGMKAIVEDGRIAEYRLTAKVSFVVKGRDQGHDAENPHRSLRRPVAEVVLRRCGSRLAGERNEYGDRG